MILEYFKEAIQKDEDFKGSKHQAILNVFYKDWRNKEYNSFSDVIIDAEKIDERLGLLIMIGKFNQQVNNGGINQYFFNGYGSSKGNNYDINLFYNLKELSERYLLEEFKDVNDYFNKILNEVNKTKEECSYCSGDGEVFVSDDEHYEECEECNGDGYIESDEFGIDSSYSDEISSEYYNLKNVEKRLEMFAIITLADLDIFEII